MYKHVRSLIISVMSYRKLLTQTIHEGIIASENICYVKTPWNNARYKRSYCQVAMNTQRNIQAENEIAQQRLNEFLSNPENKKYFQILELEVDVLRHNAERVPENISQKEWLILLDTKSRSQRKKYLGYLWCNEKSTIKRKAQKEQKKAEWLEKQKAEEQVEDTGEIKYGLSHNSLFLRIYQKTINHYYNSKAVQAMMFEPKVVFDCSYDSYMTRAENHNCAKQLTYAISSNRTHISPMFLYFCNMNKEGLLVQDFQRNMPNLLDDDFPAVVTSQSYLDLFPKDQLVYLTPHCRTVMTEYDPDMIYIIGAMVDKTNPQPLSLAKAKKEGLRMTKMPIDKYLKWGTGSTKNLTVNQILNILLDINYTKDWTKALQHVPTRKLQATREYMLQHKIRRNIRLPKKEESTRD